MARYVEPTRQQERAWEKWVAARPANVRGVAERFEPWSLYRMKSTGQRVTVFSFGARADGSVTLTVNITGEFNAMLFDRQVFGIEPDDLEPCDLPKVGEVLGAVMTTDQVGQNIDLVRAAVRPDLWRLDEAGRAVRKQDAAPDAAAVCIVCGRAEQSDGGMICDSCRKAIALQGEMPSRAAR